MEPPGIQAAAPRGDAMPGDQLTPELMALIAERFKVLAEPARLELLNALRAGERTVTDLIGATGMKQANVSKHLQTLHAAGFVERRKDGLHVYYFLADESVFELCRLVCDRLKIETSQRQRLIARL
jgi:DNA-binding transcriptional ArsR family regulator